MAREYNNRLTTRAEDWKRFGAALVMLPIGIMAAFSMGVLKILHTGKNIIVEEARRHGVELRK